jgi:hypothetical protein
LGVGWRFALSVLVVFSAAVFVSLYRVNRKHSRPRAAAVLGIFAGSYAVLLLPGLLLNLLSDRYVVPLIPVLAIYLLAEFQSEKRPASVPAWVILVAFAAYAVASSHDYSSALRARIEAARMLQARGIPRDHISAGFELDGWTQVQATGRIAGARQGIALDPSNTDQFWFWTYSTAVRPDYVVAYSQGLKEVQGLPSLSFETWLPPFRRYVTVFRRPRS